MSDATYKVDRKLTLLLVDDEEEILKMLARLFRREFNVITATGGQDGLKKFDEQRPELILSDQRMRGMTGIEMLKEMKEKEPGTVRILITGFADIDVVIEALNHKLLHRYVTKPWDNSELIEIVKEAKQIYLKNAGLFPSNRKILF
ncbi:MAG: response regulator [Proteobacteria bacterium]|nr:response regulator [Pseudomonadota bacterium]